MTISGQIALEKYYQKIKDFLRTENWINEEEIELYMEGIENYISRKLYKK